MRWTTTRVTCAALVVGAVAVVGPGVAVGAAEGTCAGLAPTVVGTDDDDRIVGTPGPDVIAGLAGNDRIEGLDGDDVLCGGPGVDTLVGGAGNDHLLAGPIGTVPVFESGPDPQGDTLVPGPGDDRLDLGPAAVRGDDYYAYDTLDLSTSVAGVRVDLTAGTVTGDGTDLIVSALPAPATGYALEVLGTAYADTMVGSPQPDLLVGGGGDDTLAGLAGDDFLLETWDEGSDSSADVFDGGPGDDSLSTGEGPDTLLGGPGRDTFDDQGGIVVMDGGRGRDHLWGYLTPNTVAITGGPGRDDLAFNVAYRGGRQRPVGGTLDLATGTLTVRLTDAPPWRARVTDVTSVGLPDYGRWRFVGSDAAEVLRGGTAPLVARGGGGNDRLLGSTKDDVLLGGRGRDEVHGRAGDDRCRAERTRHCESR